MAKLNLRDEESRSTPINIEVGVLNMFSQT